MAGRAGGEHLPDVRRLLAELARIASSRQPDLVTEDDVARLDGCADPAVAATRALCRIMGRAGMADEVRAAVARCRPIPSAERAKIDLGVETEVESGAMSAGAMLRRMDQALSSPARRRVPAWFIDEFWPGLLRRAARGDGPTDRELEVISHVIETAMEGAR